MKVEVKPSKVEGLGCFATADIAEGEVVGLYEGMLMMVDTEEDSPSKHFLYLEDEVFTQCKTCKRDSFLFGILGTGLLRYINSNQDTEAAHNVDMQHAMVVAVKPITMGEELFMDYEFDG